MDYRKKFVVEPGTRVQLGKIDPGFKDKHESREGQPKSAKWLRSAALKRPEKKCISSSSLRLFTTRWALINNDTQLLFAAIFDTEFDKYVEDARHMFLTLWISELL